MRSTVFNRGLLIFGCSGINWSSFSNCDAFKDLANSVDIAAKRAAWSPQYFTNPRDHSPTQFRYIVHAAPNAIANKPNDGRTIIEIFFDGIKKEESLRPLFSASVISEDRTATFSYSGVVLKVPEEKIVAASSNDMRSFVGEEKTPQEIQQKKDKLYKLNGLSDPLQILAKAKSGVQTGFDLRWTEVVVDKNAPSREKLQVTGLFVQCDSFGVPLINENDFDIIRTTAKDLQVPVVSIPPPKGIIGIKVTISSGKSITERMGSGSFIVSDMGPKYINFPITKARLMDLFTQAKDRGEEVWALEPQSGSFRLDSLPMDGSWRERTGTSPKLITPDDFKSQGIAPVEMKFSDGS